MCFSSIHPGLLVTRTAPPQWRSCFNPLPILWTLILKGFIHYIQLQPPTLTATPTPKPCAQKRVKSFQVMAKFRALYSFHRSSVLLVFELWKCKQEMGWYNLLYCRSLQRQQQSRIWKGAEGGELITNPRQQRVLGWRAWFQFHQ